MFIYLIRAGDRHFDVVKNPIKRFLPKTAILLIFLSSLSFAVNLEFSAINYDEGLITTRLLMTDSLSSELVGYIKKGVPVSFEFELSTWESRAGWLDRHVAKSMITHRLRYDTWNKRYAIVTQTPDIIIESNLDEFRETSDLVMSTGLIKIPLEDTSGQFYLTGRLIIKTMTLSNLREVESWLKGEISGAENPDIKDAPDKLGEFLFNTALKITGLKNISGETRTEFFNIVDGKIVYIHPGQ